MAADLYEQKSLYAASQNKNSIKLSVDFSHKDFVCCFPGEMQETFSDDAISTRDCEHCDYISSPKEKQITIKNISDFSDLRILYRSLEITVKYTLLYSLLPTFTCKNIII